MTRVEAALEVSFPDRSVASVTRPAEGNRKETAIVTFEDGERVVVQCADDPTTFEAETRLIEEIAAGTSVPVPAVISSGAVGSGRYRVTEYVEGDSLHTRFSSLQSADRTRIARRFGRVLAAVHDAFEFDRFGGLAVEDGELSAIGPPTYDRWFRSYAREGIDALPPAFGDLEPVLSAAIEERTPLIAPTPRLFAWDIRPGNAIAVDGRIAAVLDWGEPLAAAAGLSLAKAEHLVCEWYVDEPEPLRAAFRAGYGAVRSLPTVRRADRLVAVLRSAVDSHGEVTRPGYPERTGAEAVAFHRDRLTSML